MTRLALILAIVLGAATVDAQTQSESETTLADISGQILRGNILCSDFEQEKNLQALARPLLSSGKLIFVAGQGVLWQVLTPYPARLLVRADELIEWDDDGTARKSGYGKTPVFRALSSIFLAMFQGRVEILRDAFNVSTIRIGTSWRLDLTPKDEILAAAISQVQVSGGRHVKEISILEPRGDRTLIRFRNPRIESCKLDDIEKSFFAL